PSTGFARSVTPVDGKIDGLDHGILHRPISKQAECVARHGAVVPGALNRRTQGAVLFHQGDRLLEVALVLLAALQSALPERPLLRVAPPEGQDHRQGDLPFLEVVADILAEARAAPG